MYLKTIGTTFVCKLGISNVQIILFTLPTEIKEKLKNIIKIMVASCIITPPPKKIAFSYLQCLPLPQYITIFFSIC